MNYGRYQIVKEIGKGSMGVVFQAHDPNLDLLVALKVLRPDRVVDGAFVRRFLSEAKALGRLDHPNIVRVYNVDEDGGTVYIAMEFLEGEPLNEVIRNKKFTYEEIIELGITVSDALDYAHQKGIVHRDIKPSNILLRPEGRPKITDFGIAHIEDASAEVQTQAGEILGTPAYMSPEQVLSRPVDGRSDIFSLGIILYEMCAGVRPFGGANLAAIFHAITQDEPAQIATMNPAIPEELSRVIMKCLRKNPAERFATGRALAEALRGCLRKKEGLAPGERAVPRKTKSTGLLILLVILLIIMAGGGAYYGVHRRAEVPATKKARPALLKVESSPPGAQVFVDGTFKGKTPLKLETFIGKHEVKLNLQDYHDWEAQVELNEEGETPLSVLLVPVDGR